MNTLAIPLSCKLELIGSTALESTKARKDYDEAEHSLKLTKEEKQKAEEEYAELFDIDGYGAQGEWKKLDDLCLEKEVGE